MAVGWQQHGDDSAAVDELPKNQPKTAINAAKKTQAACRSAGQSSKRWNYRRFRR
jgi:hypothetical protein